LVFVKDLDNHLPQLVVHKERQSTPSSFFLKKNEPAGELPAILKKRRRLDGHCTATPIYNKNKKRKREKRPPLGEGPIKTADGGGSRN
jgi:hypothetical protein